MGVEQEKPQVEAGLRAVLYVRISDDPSGLERGVDRQEADCRALAEAHGMGVVAVYRENDTSAFKQRTITLPTGEKVRRVIRPQFRAMLKFLADGGANVMIAYDLDRAVRDPRDLEDLIDAKVLYRFAVRSVTGSLRLDTDSDIAMARVLVAMANKSSADTARRVARAQKQMAVEGKWHGGSPPFGYRAADCTLYVVPEQAALLREAVDRVIAGESLYKIIRDWNGRGLKTPRNVAWSDKALRLALRNPATKGIREYRPMLPDGTYAPEPEIVTQASWEPLLDEQAWQQVNDVLDARRSTLRKFKSNKRIYPFSGIIRCSGCGRSMRRQGPHYVCMSALLGGCARAIKASEVTAVIEDAVLSVFEQITTNPRRQPGRDGPALEARAGLAAALEQDRDALNRLDDDYYDGAIEKATWARQRSRLTDRIARTQQEFAALLPVTGPSVNVATAAAEWSGRGVEWRHQVTSLVLEQVLIHAHPQGVSTIVSKRREDTSDTYKARLAEHRAGLLARRVEFVWRA
jgi:DNA invertase Pin-like site-specific DNA recombinase